MNDPDPAQVASLEELAECLRQLYVRADKPSLRELEDRTKLANGVLPGTQLRRVRLGRTTLNDVLRGFKLPKKAFLLTLVETLNVDLKTDPRWGQAWDRLAVQDLDQAAAMAERLRQQLAEAEARADRADKEAERLRQQATEAMNETTITVTGNLVDQPELRFTLQGQPIARFRIATTPRYRDRDGEWKDGDSVSLTCYVRDQAAENVAESLQQGTRVIVTGRLRQRSYETKEGEKRTVYELEADEVGPSLRVASAKVQLDEVPELMRV